MTRRQQLPSITYLCVLALFTLFFLGISPVDARQASPRAKLDHPLNAGTAYGTPGSITPHFPLAQPETLRILAAMVEFQEDGDFRTTGTGTFMLSDSMGRVLDAPPHNESYFHQHLTFAENYFRKSSDGKLIVQGTILANVYRLPALMQRYSPPRSSTTNAELGMLMRDAWHLIDSVTPGIPYEQYGAFLLFHAGVGRDIDLVSICGGFDPTPFDIPSIYINLPALKKAFGDSYEGVPVRNGSYFINNTIILPETESRYLDCVGGNLRLGINGLLVASIGSHLGLPDLFNTSNGRSGIGRFGLMDGQSIFSWNGLFPPQPSAWERYFLGWIQPITITGGNDIYSFPAASLANQPDSVYRVLISDREYFLVENRNRDAHRDGATVTMAIHDSTITQTWYRDTVGFNAFNTNSLFGVVTDVDEFDWSLPGGVNTRTGEWFDGGILVWHIDENVIEATISTDAVNADAARRGVDLEEADGSQDIGQSYGFLEAGSGSEDGTQFDFWYSGNTAPVRKQLNAFTPTSLPDSRSNDLGNSHVYIKDFSARGPSMTARIQIGDEQVAPLAGFPKIIEGEIGNRSIRTFQHVPGGPEDMIIGTSRFVYGWTSNGSAILPELSSNGILARAPLIGNGRRDYAENVVIKDFNHDQTLEFGFLENEFSTLGPPSWFFSTYSLHDANADSLPDPLFGYAMSSQFTTSPVASDSFIAIGAKYGSVYLLRYDGTFADSIRVVPTDTSDIVGINLLSLHNELLAVSQNGSVEYVVAGVIPDRVTSRDLGKSVAASAVSGAVSSTVGQAIALGAKDGSVFLMDTYFKDFSGFPVSTGGEIANSPALADIDGDGRKDIIVFSGNKIFAINHAGVILDNFPITTLTSKTILTSPIVADLNGDGLPDIVAVTQEGLIVAYDRSGKLLSGFPLQSGINNGSTPAAFYIPSDCLSCADIGLAVASDDGNVYAWKTGTLTTGPAAPPAMPWPQYMHDAQSTGLSDTVLQIHSNPNGFFPAARAYNWPNPVGRENGFKTHIRYFVGSDATVHIKIFDIAGDLVTELQGQATGGIDNEVEWDVSGIQSGVYLAHIDATGSGGSGSAVIKIAVVK